MSKYTLKKIQYSDYPILHEWLNDRITRKNSFNQSKVNIEEHQNYIKNLIKDKDVTQYIFYDYSKPIGTIKEKKLPNHEIELSYTVSPLERNKKIGSKMMMNYLEGRKGKFICLIKQDNLASIKMVESCGFKFSKLKDEVAYYRLKVNNE